MLNIANVTKEWKRLARTTKQAPIVRVCKACNGDGWRWAYPDEDATFQIVAICTLCDGHGIVKPRGRRAH